MDKAGVSPELQAELTSTMSSAVSELLAEKGIRIRITMAVPE